MKAETAESLAFTWLNPQYEKVTREKMKSAFLNMPEKI